MSGILHDHRVFWRQFRRQYHTTGALVPSSRFLARALVRYVGGQAEGGQKILEVGPGTGAVTAQIVRRMRSGDSLDLVESNDAFVRRLNERLATEQAFRSLGDRVRVTHGRVEDLPREGQYDVIVSGLPLNNFAVTDVEQILDAFRGLLRPGGVLSFFEYVAIRPARALLSGPAQRRRLRGIAAALAGLLGPHEIERDCVWPNLPPAWVHHVRLPL
jgi:phosphatidylethanolamine/phosphatidyl-N-methylethanolamine N-methyltransferase